MEDLWRREQGQLVLDARGLTHRPHKFLAAATGHLGLVSRLHLAEELPASGALYSTSWSSDASRLISAGEDCRLRIWQGYGSQLLHTVDTVRGLPKATLALRCTCAALPAYQHGVCQQGLPSEAPWQAAQRLPDILRRVLWSRRLRP